MKGRAFSAISFLQSKLNREWIRFKTDRFVQLFLLLIIAELLVLLCQCQALVDDAYISARYARNLAEGFGLVYNRGVGLERVEGYSNFFWVLLLAVGIKIGLSVRFLAQFYGVVFALCGSVLAFLWIKKETGSRWLGLLGMSFIGSNIYFAIWQVEGLETPLFGLVILGSIYCLSQGKNLPAMIFALLASLTRPDGVLVFLSIALVQVQELIKKRIKLKPIILIWLWFIVPYFIYFLWRAVYYHSFLPNTFYAKTGLGWVGLREGLLYFKDFFVQNPGIIFLILIIFYAIFWKKSLSFSIKAGLVFIGFYFLFLFLVGGDWMPSSRLLVPLLPLFYCIGITIIHSQFVRAGLKRVILFLLCFSIVGANVFYLINYNLKDSFDKDWHRNQDKFYVPVADWLKKYVWQNQTIALGDIGYIGYFGDHDRIIDTMGLVDRHLGRLPGISSLNTDLNYIFAQKPFCIVTMVNKYEEGVELGHSEFDRRIYNDQRFFEDYYQVIEIYGWHSEELSRSDWKKRQSKVFFRIFFYKSQ